MPKIHNLKIYDAIGRIVPEEVYYEDPFKDDSEFFDWFVKRRISSVGLLWNRQSVLWQGVGGHIYDNSFRNGVFEKLVREGSIVQIGVESTERPFYINAEDLHALEQSGYSQAGKEIRFLAPLDNMIWEREQTKELFGFDFSWEVYLPAHKRKYGYYVLPVLYGSKFIGRIEPVIDKKEQKLVIRNLWLTEELTDDLHAALLHEIELFCEYVKCVSYEFTPDACIPDKKS